MTSPRKINRGTGRPLLPATLLALLLGASLVACKPAPEAPREPTVGQKADQAAVNAQNRASEATANVKGTAAEMRADANVAVAKASSAAKDAAITTAVNAKLIADPTLKTFRINVDTNAGRVGLSGDAPDSTARERATSLVRSVDGVISVNNQLTIKGKS